MNAAVLKVCCVLRQAALLLSAVLVGATIGHVLIIGYCCARSWYEGGSADPRCAAWIVRGYMKGYVEVHNLAYKPERISCEYEPQVGAP